MKKVLTILLGMVLVLSMVWGASAATLDYDESEEGDVIPATVTYSISQSYTVTIPSKIDIDTTSGQGSETVAVKITQIAPHSFVNVTLEDGDFNDATKRWFLSNNLDDTETLEYLIDIDRHVDPNLVVSGSDAQSPVQPNTVVLSVSADHTEKVTAEIHCRVMAADAAISHAGSYSGTLNFVFDVVVPNPASP